MTSKENKVISPTVVGPTVVNTEKLGWKHSFIPRFPISHLWLGPAPDAEQCMYESWYSDLRLPLTVVMTLKIAMTLKTRHSYKCWKLHGGRLMSSVFCSESARSESQLLLCQVLVKDSHAFPYHAFTCFNKHWTSPLLRSRRWESSSKRNWKSAQDRGAHSGFQQLQESVSLYCSTNPHSSIAIFILHECFIYCLKDVVELIPTSK